jgi:hypothetical protein
MSVGGVVVGRVAKERLEPGRGIAVPGAVTRQSLSATSRVFDAGTVVLSARAPRAVFVAPVVLSTSAPKPLAVFFPNKPTSSATLLIVPAFA